MSQKRADVAKYLAQNKIERINKIVSSSISIYTCMGALVLFVSTFLSYNFHSIFKLDQAYLREAEVVILIIGINIAQGLVFNVFFGVLMGIQRFDIFNRVMIVFSIIRAILIVILLKLGYGIIALSIIELGISLISNLIAYLYCRKLIPELRILWFHNDKSYYKKIINYSLITFIIQISMKLIYFTDTFVIGIFLSVSAVTFFAISGNLINYLKKLISQMAQVFNPLTSELEAQNGNKKIKDVLFYGTKYSLLISLPICIVYLIMGETFIELWMGKEYAHKCYPVLFALTVSHMFAFAQYTTGNILYGLHKHKFSAYLQVSEGIVNLILSIYLVKKLGILGVAIGTAVPSLIVSTIFYPKIITSILKVNLYEYIIKSYISPFISTIPFSCFIYFVNTYLPSNSLLMFFLQVLMAMPIYFMTVWLISFKKEERIQNKEIIMSFVLGRNKK